MNWIGIPGGIPLYLYNKICNDAQNNYIAFDIEYML